MKPRFLIAGLLAALIAPQALMAQDIAWDTLGERKQQEADAAINAFLDQQLLALRTKLDATPCRLSVLKTASMGSRYHYSDKPQPPPKNCGEYWTEREQQFWQRWRSGVIDNKDRNAAREAVAWPGNFDRLKALLEQKLQPLQRRDIRPYVPYGAYENVPGAEYLLRDGRTILGISRDTVYRDGGQRLQTHLQFSVFDVRSLPGPGSSSTHYRTYGRGNTADNFDTSATLSAGFDPTAHRALATWGDRYEPGRKVDTRLLDPARAGQVQIAPELADFGRELAERRWDRLAFVTDTVAQMARQQKDRARIAERANAAWYRREMARSRARWARDSAESTPQTNAIAAGIIQGLNNAARTQQFWNARAAEAQARYFQAQHGCRPGFCGGGSDGGRDRNDRDGRNDGSDRRRRDADVARAPASTDGAPDGSNAARTARPSGSDAGTGNSMAATNRGAPGGASPSSAVGTDAAPTQPTHYVTGQYAKAGTQAQACAAAKSMTALDSQYRDKLTGNVADKCVCTNPGAALQRMIDNDRRKRDEATEQWIKDQYTSAIGKREEKIRTEGWSCHADFEARGPGAPTR